MRAVGDADRAHHSRGAEIQPAATKPSALALEEARQYFRLRIWGFTEQQARHLIQLRAAVQRGDRREGDLLDVSTRARLRFMRWLVQAGRLREWS